MGVLGNALGGAIVVQAPLSTVAVVTIPDVLNFPLILNLFRDLVVFDML